ncbi:hypothetical protein SVAN01_07504 [Stagonosporopsis vannaccii]|nr:hypothetical protein SVAN01_07504 [Stagonosporopsis vannaccii]
MKGDPMDSCVDSIGDGYTIVSRGYDWTVRCVYQLHIPETWKTWLETMYEKQPEKIVDHAEHNRDDSFLDTVVAAANIGGFETMIPLVKFWLRQVFTIVEVWNTRLMVEGNEESSMPPYQWCEAAYYKMWYRFRNELRDPFSDYPYVLRQELLRKLSYQRVFEHCWGWVYQVTVEIGAKDFDPSEVRETIHSLVLTAVQNKFQTRYRGTESVLKEEFGSRTGDERYQLLDEGPLVSVFSLEGDLHATSSVLDLCEEFYYSADEDEDAYMGELEMTEDVEMEAYGSLIELAQFTTVKQPAPDDFCSCCQEMIFLGDSHEMRCLVPVACNDTFHASCLADWVNSTSSSALTSAQTVRRR